MFWSPPGLVGPGYVQLFSTGLRAKVKWEYSSWMNEVYTISGPPVDEVEVLLGTT